jgi:hypothetical protein|tara:strand:+ start:804 stop:974 length:171 start_codon:yes stop_codon:yes gene_type:complete
MIIKVETFCPLARRLDGFIVFENIWINYETENITRRVHRDSVAGRPVRLFAVGGRE